MLNNKLKPFACMAWLKNEHGFNFITMLTMISIIFLTIPFFSYSLQQFKPESNYEELSVNEFYRFLRDEMIESYSYYIDNDALYLLKKGETTVRISQYTDVIRKQVVGKSGQEIYLRDVERMKLVEQPSGLKIILTSKSGETYEKLLPFYNQT